MATKTHDKIKCYGQTLTRNCQQEWYETVSRDAGVRTRFLKKQGGFKTVLSSMGLQVTNVGLVKMTLVTIYWENDEAFDRLLDLNPTIIRGV